MNHSKVQAKFRTIWQQLEMQSTPNMSPAFMHAARNYDILGGMQRTRASPMEMMSARERAEIMNMGSNFNVPNYNSPYYHQF